jgi:hypothetical protein
MSRNTVTEFISLSHLGGPVIQPIKTRARSGLDESPGPESSLRSQPTMREIHSDARRIPLADMSVDLVVTSPPYWRKRDYGFPGQIGQESTPQEYVDNLIMELSETRRIYSEFGSVFLKIGDTNWNR